MKRGQGETIDYERRIRTVIGGRGGKRSHVFSDGTEMSEKMKGELHAAREGRTRTSRKRLQQ